MFGDASVVRFVPDSPGKGGTKTGFHSFQTQPLLDTRYVTDFHVWLGRWRKEWNPVAYVWFTPLSGLFTISGLHSFTRPDITSVTTAPKTNILIDYVTNGGLPSRIVWDDTRAQYVANSNAYALPTEFVSIGQRCFMSMGGYGNPLIYEGQDIPPIHPAPYGTGYAIGAQFGAYYLGIGQPKKAPSYSIVTTTQTTGTLSSAITFMRYDSPWLTSNDYTSPIATFPEGLSVTISDNYNTVAGGTAFTGVPWSTTVKTPGKALDSTKGDIVAIGTGTIGVGVPGSVVFSIDTLLAGAEQYIGLEVYYKDDANVDRHFTIGDVVLQLATTEFWPVLDTGGNLPATFGTPGNITSQPWSVKGAQVQLAKSSAILDASYFVGGIPHPGWIEVATTAADWWWETTYLGGGDLSWADVGPSYAYAWYDPTTGHISNVSDVTTISETNQYLSEIRLPISGVDIDYPPVIDRHRFPFTVWFRSVVSGGGSALFPLGQLPTYAKITNVTKYISGMTVYSRYTVDRAHGMAVNDFAWIDDVLGLSTPDAFTVITNVPSATQFDIAHNSGTGTYTPNSGRAFFAKAGITNYLSAFHISHAPGTTWTDDFKDEALLVSGGLQAPMFTNGRPLDPISGGDAYFKHIAYWDGRTWGTTVAEPDVVIFSCDAIQCPFGVATESYPKSNRLRIPAQDGTITGIKLVGDALIVLTSRYAYYVAGNNETNYRLLRYSSSMPGVGPKQVTELVSQTSEQGATIVYLGRDNIVYAYSPGQEPVKLSTPIQPTLDTALAGATGAYSASFVHAANISGRRVVIVGIPAPTLPIGTMNYSPALFLYDIENKVWTNRTISGFFPTACASQYGVGAPSELMATAEALTGTGRVSKWFIPGGQTLPFAGIITFPTDFDGKKTKKALRFVRLYTNYDNATAFSVNVYVDETTKLSMVGKVQSDPIYNIYGPDTPPWSYQPVDGNNAREYIALPNDITSTFENKAGITTSVVGEIVGYRFAIEVFGGGTTPADIFAIDVCYSTVGEDSVVA